MSLAINTDPQAIADFCRRHHLTKFAFFGSVITEKFGADSDIDVLFEYEQGHTPTLLDVADMECELAEMFQRKVDLRTAQDLSRYFRDEVVRTAYVQYAAWHGSHPHSAHDRCG